MRRALLLLTLTVLAVGGMSLATRAQVSLLPDRIEEDWQLVIANPDPTSAGPQMTTTMSPTGDLTSAPFVAFDMNYREYPDFTPGGMQIQVWNGQDLVQTDSQGSSQASTANETITWTQQLKLSSGTLTYSILNGQSTTWGAFGTANGLNPITFATSLQSLAGYSPDVTISRSGVSWQSNRVTNMSLVAVRYYAGDVLIATDTTRRECLLPP